MTDVNGERKRAPGRGVTPNRILVLVICLVIIATAAVVIILLSRNSRVKKEVTLEAGGVIEVGMFLKDPGNSASFLTDVDAIDTSVPGSRKISILVNSKRYTSTLTVVDTVPPVGVPVEVTVELGELPDPADCVTGIVDATKVTITYKEAPDVHTRGQHAAVILLTDAGGNTASVISVVTVYADSIPPMIKGARDISAYVGNDIDFLSGITVSDTVDGSPVLDVDLSDVNFNTPGRYNVTYRARDKSGNTSEFTVSLVLREQRTHDVAQSVVISLARDVLSRFTSSRMDKMDVAYAIYRWVRNSISYIPSSSEDVTWTGAAYDAFQTRSGDAFSCYAVTKALLTAAGIDNLDIQTSDSAAAPHYWCLINLGDGWYHMDPFSRPGDDDNFFMLTDAELEQYSVSHNHTHPFNGDKYPARATVSVQDMVDYSSSTLNRESSDVEDDEDGEAASSVAGVDGVE